MQVWSCPFNSQITDQNMHVIKENIPTCSCMVIAGIFWWNVLMKWFNSFWWLFTFLQWILYIFNGVMSDLQTERYHRISLNNWATSQSEHSSTTIFLSNKYNLLHIKIIGYNNATITDRLLLTYLIVVHWRYQMIWNTCRYK